MRAPVDLPRLVHRNALHRVADGRLCLGPGLEELERERGDVGGDAEPCHRIRGVAAPAEGGVNAAYAHHGRRMLPLEAVDEAPVHAFGAVRGANGQVQQVRAGQQARARRPGDAVPAGTEAAFDGPNLPRVLASDEHVHRDGRGTGEPEAHHRLVAKAVSVGRDRRQQPAVAGEWEAARDAEVVEPRRGRGSRGGGR